MYVGKVGPCKRIKPNFLTKLREGEKKEVEKQQFQVGGVEPKMCHQSIRPGRVRSWILRSELREGLVSNTKE